MAQSQSELPESEKFKTTSEEETIFRETYGKRIERNLFLLEGNKKNLTIAIDQRYIGNDYLAERKYKEAMRHYDKGILFCPQDTVFEIMARAKSARFRMDFLSNLDEPTKIKQHYEMLVKKDLDLTQEETKDLMTALEERRMGNECYAKKKFKEALQHYCNGILSCPQNSEGAKEVLCLIIANRTAINIEFENYGKVLDDITYLEEIGNYPVTMKFKIIWRKAKCYEALGDFDQVDKLYDETIKSLMEDSKLKGKELNDKIKAVEDSKKNKRRKCGTASSSKSGTILDIERFQGSEKYPAASPLINIIYDENQGRHAVALEDIPIGTLIVKEEPHVSLVDKDRSLTNCHFCFAYIDQLVACSTCANVAFCSTVCKNKADQSFHKIECPIYPTLVNSFDKLLSLRILTQRGFSFFDDQSDRLLSFLDSDDQGITTKTVYRSDDYDNMLFLFRNVGLKKYDQLYLNAAVYLLRILKTTDFFPFETKDDVLLDEEVFIGRLILRHCKVMTYNVHGINELKYYDYNRVQKDGMGKKHLIEGIGVGIYPTLAFFSHSCEPSIVRYNDKKRVIVRTIRPIRAGDIIYDNYGPNYLFMPLAKRQESLQTDYCFKCVCPPCVEKWPMFKEMESVVKIPCKTPSCEHVFTLTETRRPRRCYRCRRALHSSDINLITEPISVFYNDAEKLFQEKKFGDALKAYKTVLEIKYTYNSRPDLDVVKVQERIEHIFARNGNVGRPL